MKKGAIWAIILLMSAALIGIVIIQVYWIGFSLRLNEQQFDKNVMMALARVADKLEEEKNTSPLLSDGSTSVFGTKTDIGSFKNSKDFSKEKELWEKRQNRQYLGEVDIAKMIDPVSLDKILSIELNNRQIITEYQYGIYSNTDSAFVIGNKYYRVDLGEPKASDVVTHEELETTQYSVDLFTNLRGAAGELRIFFPRKTGWLWRDLWKSLFASVIFSGLILFCFSYTIWVIFRQKKVSEMKTDFINNMTHEFKTPIATISLATDSIESPMVINDVPKIKRFTNVIKQENQRMLSQVEKVLQMALLDKKDFNLRTSMVDMHDLILKAADHIELQVHRRDGTIKTILEAPNHIIEGDVTHLSNIIHNLLDNANKYTVDSPKIIVSTDNMGNMLRVTITDNGVGLSNESQKHIFDKFYRVHTGDLHDVKGFGLGLSYVKAMVTAHKGDIQVNSELGKGSSFIISLPMKLDNNLS